MSAVYPVVHTVRSHMPLMTLWKGPQQPHMQHLQLPLQVLTTSSVHMRSRHPTVHPAPTPSPPPPSRGARRGKHASQAPASTPSRPAKRSPPHSSLQDTDCWCDASSEDVLANRALVWTVLQCFYISPKRLNVNE